jgi:quercetin dioxygenase-like cupin family protein
LRQTVITLLQGRGLDEHVSPGEATIFVLQGRVAMESGGNSWTARVGDLLIVPASNLTLRAMEDSAVLFTVAKFGRDSGPNSAQQPADGQLGEQRSAVGEH